jgi:SET domain-containing protein
LKTGKKGWGVKAGSDIKAGQFIIEYVGEVISMEEALKRMGVDKNTFKKNNETSSEDSDIEDENFRTISKKRLKTFLQHSKPT